MTQAKRTILGTMSPQLDLGEQQYRSGRGDSRSGFNQGASSLCSSPSQGSHKYREPNAPHLQDYPPPPRFGTGPPLRHPPNPQEQGQQQHRQDSLMQREHHHHHHQPPSQPGRSDVSAPATLETHRPEAGGHGSGESPGSSDTLPRRTLLFSSSPPSLSSAPPGRPSSAEHGGSSGFSAPRKFHPINSGYRNEQPPYDAHRHNGPNETSFEQQSNSSSRPSSSKAYNLPDRHVPHGFEGGRDEGQRQYHQHRRGENSESYHPGSQGYGGSYPPPHYHQQNSHPRQEHHSFHGYQQDGYFRPHSDGRTSPSHEVSYPNKDGPRRPPSNSPESRGRKHSSNGDHSQHSQAIQSHNIQASPNETSQMSNSSRESRQSFGEAGGPPSDTADQMEKNSGVYEEEGAKPQPSSSASSMRRVTPEYHEDKLSSHQPPPPNFSKQVESTPTRSDYDEDRRMLYGIQTGGMVESPPRLSSSKHPRDGAPAVDTPAPMAAPPPPLLQPGAPTPSAATTPNVNGRNHYGVSSSVSAWSRPTPSPCDGTDKENMRPGFGPGSSSSHHYQFGSTAGRSHQQTPYQHQDSYGEYHDTATPIRRDRSSNGPMYHAAYSGSINDPSTQDRHHYSHHHHPGYHHHHPYGDIMSPFQHQPPWVGGPPPSESGHMYSTPAFRRNNSAAEPSPGSKAAAAVLSGRMSHETRYSYDSHGYEYYRPPHVPYEDSMVQGYHRHHMEDRQSSVANKRPSPQSETESNPTRTSTSTPSNNNNNSASTSANKSSSSKPSRRKKMYSDYVGVTYNKTHAKFQACITHYRKQHYLGRYKLAVDAARAYDESAKLLKGNGWKINFGSVEEYERAKKRELAEIEEKKRKAEDIAQGGEANKKPRISNDTTTKEGEQERSDEATETSAPEGKVDADHSPCAVKHEEPVAISPQTPAIPPNEISATSIPTSTPPDFKQELGPRRVSVETTEMSPSDGTGDSDPCPHTPGLEQAVKDEAGSGGKRETAVITPTDERVPSPSTTTPSSEPAKVESEPIKNCEGGSTSTATSTMTTPDATAEVPKSKKPQTVSPSGKENSSSSAEAPRASTSQANGGPNTSGGGVLQNGTLAGGVGADDIDWSLTDRCVCRV